MKILECPDFHFSPSWSEWSETAGNAIADAAKNADVVLFAGDIYDRPVYATESGGINKLRKIIKKISAVAPVAAVYGTPSHDARGSLAVLEDCGLVVLQPGQTYYLSKGKITTRPDGAELMLFGIPEPSKRQVGDEAEAKLAEYVTGWLAPARAAYPDLPAVCMYHGTVSNTRRENSSDIIIKNTDILLYTDDMRIANIDRWTLGHIHEPKEFADVCAGYAGFAGMSANAWKHRNFLPAMNLVDVKTGKIERIPYGLPERKKVYSLNDVTDDKNVAYWFVTNDKDAQLPEGVHPLSRISYIEEEKQTERRLTSDKQLTLVDLFKLYNPDVSDSVLDKVKQLEKVKAEFHKPVDITLNYVHIKNCVFFKGKNIVFDLASQPNGITAIMGDNGAGKSSLLAFCTPYPVVVGKDTPSGRVSAIKDFFTGKGEVVKRFVVNGQEHEHKIKIGSKTECYIYVNGSPQLDKGTFDEMLEWCEAEYGPMSDYLVTTFYPQPLQGKMMPALMGASVTNIRDTVLSVSGIDREDEKRAALDKVAEIEQQLIDKIAYLRMSGDVKDKLHAKKAQLEQVQEQISQITDKLTSIKEQIDKHEIEYTALQAQVEENNKAKKQLKEKKELQEKLHNLKNLVVDISAIEKRLQHDSANRELAQKAEQIKRENEIKTAEARLAHSKLITEIRERNNERLNKYRNALADYRLAKEKLQVEIANLKKLHEELYKPCPNCGYIPEQAQNIITELEQKEKLYTEICKQEPPQPATEPEPDYIAPELVTVPTAPSVLTQTEREALEYKLKLAVETRAKITQLEEQIKSYPQTIKIDWEIDNKVAELQKQITLAKDMRATYLMRLGQYKGSKEQLISQIAELEANIKHIKETEKEVKQLKAEQEDWKYIANDLQASKIPAFELEISLDAIDKFATELLSDYKDGRYTYRTVTQQQGKTKTVDRFDILIHDNQTGVEKSITQYSPGEKAFLADAYTKALVYMRNSKAHRKYSPVILDESDAPIQPELIADFYSLQAKFWDTKVLVVSHSPAAHEHFTSKLNIEEAKR